jgi:hypothetical protein
MSSYVGLSRRRGGERRIWNVSPGSNHRSDDRRQDANTYFLVLGHGGIDGVSVACLVAMVLIVIIVTV